MTKRYPGGYITKTAPTVSTTSAPGIWTMEQQAAYQKAGTWPFGGPFNYIEDVFSTWLYTGNGSTQTITNGIDLSGQGGVVWVKSRSNAYDNWIAADASSTKLLITNATDAAYSNTGGFANWQYTSSGFNLLSTAGSTINGSGSTFTSWTFRKQPKFFDVVTYTGNGAANRYVNHSLASVPGCIILKRTDAASDWAVWHRVNGGSTTCTEFSLNQTGTPAPGFTATHTSTQFALDEVRNINNDFTNVNGATYVAYLFAHNAGGFGSTNTDNVISCGSYTGNSSYTGPIINLGYEPQWVMIKNTTTAGYGWSIYDNMRGVPTGPNDVFLQANTSDAEATTGLNEIDFQATGFQLMSPSYRYNASGDTYIYIAIRRGPMKTPTSGTSVFSPAIYTGDDVNGRLISSGFPVDSAIIDPRNGYSTPGGPNWFSRLTGNGYFLQTAQTNAESNGNYNSNGIMGQDGITVARTGTNVWSNVASNTYVSWFLRRAPGFFDVVCYTGTGSATSQTHNLGVVPELIIVKGRSAAFGWATYSATLGIGYYLTVNNTAAAAADPSNVLWNNVPPTSTTFRVGTNPTVNGSGSTYVAYLFASCPGVSKVGSYSGTGATQTISCGFAARFVLIKRTDSTGDWFVWDTARGMVAGTDPRLALNDTAAETNANWVYTDASGFQIVTTDATVNASGGSYIYLAIS